VSRWSAERLRIGLGPDRVDCVRLGPWPRRRVLRRSGAPFTARPPEPAWQPALDVLDESLGAVASRGDAVELRLSNRWVRYGVLPWHAGVTGSAELEQLARLRFEQHHGNAVAGWTIRCCDDGFGRPLLACAIDTALLEALQERLAAHGLRLASLQPLLMAAFNDWRRRLGQSAALALVEADRLCLAAFEHGRWVEVISRRCGADIAATVEQEIATLPLQQAPQQLGVALIGDGAHWPEPAGEPAVQMLGRRELALCGAA
jgi:hypothetical protein